MNSSELRLLCDWRVVGLQGFGNEEWLSQRKGSFDRKEPEDANGSCFVKPLESGSGYLVFPVHSNYPQLVAFRLVCWD